MNIDFWLGKIVAEALVGLVIMVLALILAVVVAAIAFILDKRKKRR